MRIGIDIDGVLTDVFNYIKKSGEEFFNKNIVDETAYYVKDEFKITDAESSLYWKAYMLDYAKNEPPRKNASEIISKLKNEGNQIYIVTTRCRDLSYCNVSSTEMEDIVRNWFKENNIYYDKIVFSKGDKKQDCIDNNIDILIDDKPKNLVETSTIIPVICFDAPYNKKVNLANSYRVYNFNELYETINQIKATLNK